MRENGSVDHLPTPGNDYLNFRAVLQARLAAQQHNLQPASARHVLEVVAGFTNGTPARPSYDTLASITGLGTYQVRRLIDALVEAGYLTETREPRKGGGWGKPKWALGHTCQVLSEPHLQVVPEPHMSQEQVLPTPHSSVATATLASVATATPKRKATEETLEEKGATPPQPPTPAGPAKTKPEPYSKQKQTTKTKPDHIEPNGTRVGDYIAALTNAGHADLASLSGADIAFVASATFDVEDFAACMVAIADGTWGDAWIKGKLSIRNVHQYRWPQWITRNTPTAPTADVPKKTTPTGLPDTVESGWNWMQMSKQREERARADDARGVLPRLRAPEPGF